MTVLAVPVTCTICNGRGQILEGMACPSCGGTGVSTEEMSAKYQAVLTATALEAAQERYRAAGRDAADGWLREAAATREVAAEARRQANLVLDALARAQAMHTAVKRTLADTQAMHAEARAIVQQAGEFTPFSFPVTPPGHPTFPLPGATGDPLLIIDSILVRELDVWGALNVSGGSGGLMTNPMTTLGDLITGGALGVPQRLGIGTAAQVLTVVGGVPAWANNPAGFTNPMTTTGDIIISNPGSTAVRLGIGTAGQFLGISGGLPAWANPPSGFANPMTTTGDIIIGNPGGTAARVGIGTAGQVLGVSGGLPTWITNPAGFTNPMTTSGDMIVASAGGTAVRLPAGLNGQELVMSGGLPTWQSQGVALAYLFPTGDISGTNDDAAFATAVASLPSGGVIQMAPGAFYTKAGWVVPAQTVASPYGSTIAGNPVSIQGCGPASTLFPVGNNITGVYYHRTTSYGGQFGLPADPSTGYLRDFVIDGTRATGASIGLDCGDGRGFSVDLTVQNFTGTGAIGFNFVKRLFWTEKNCLFRCQSYNNSTAVVVGNPLALTDVSQEYNFYDILMFCNMDQQGVVLSGGVNNGGSEFKIRGNMSLSSSTSVSGIPTNNIAMLTLVGTGSQGGSRIYQGRVFTKVEGNSGNGTGNVYPYGIYSDGNGYFREVFGQIEHSLNGNGSTAGPGSQLNGAEFGFFGRIDGDPALMGTTTGGSAVMSSNSSALVVVGSISGAGTVASFTNTGTSPTGPPVLMQGVQVGDHMLGIQVTGDSNPRWKVDVGGDTLWGSGAAVQDVDLGRNAAGVLLVGGGTANTANLRLGIAGTGRSVLSLAESSSAPSTIASTGLLYVASNGSLHYLSPAGTDTQIGPP